LQRLSTRRDDIGSVSIAACVNRETICGTVASCNIDDDIERFFRSGLQRRSNVLRVVDRRALRALVLARQYFLKRDAVFLDVLVYSGCSAFRFPSARSE